MPKDAIDRGALGRLSSKARYLLSGIAFAVALHTLIEVARAVPLERRVQGPSVSSYQAPLEPMSVNPAWILAGNPKIDVRAFASSPDGMITSGVWECSGPTKIRWEYDIDETIYILEGSVTLEYDGIVRTLGPSSVAFFRAGSNVIWNIPEHVKKSFSLSEPGRIRRLIRKVL